MMEELAKAIKEAMNELGNRTRKKTLLGTVPRSLSAQFRLNDFEEERIKKEIKHKMEDYKLQLQAEYHERIEAHKEKEEELWKQVYTHLGVPSDGEHSINLNTCEVYLEEDEDENESMMGAGAVDLKDFMGKNAKFPIN